MKTSVAFSLAVSPILVLLATCPPADAASPAYCALYAREYATSRIGAPITTEDASALQRVEDQAYYRCLNQDEAPQFPTTSAYFGAPLEDITGEGTDAGGPFQALQIHARPKIPAQAAAAAQPDSQPKTGGTAVQTASADIATPPAPLTASAHGGHGTQGTPEWTNWCKAHYRSFDEQTGYVLTLSGVKKLCP